MVVHEPMQTELARATCGAMSRNGEPCQHPAGFRTQHPGEGRCYLHGGMSPRGADSPSFKHGNRSRYTAVLKTQLAEKLDLLENHDPVDIVDELQLQRALLLDFIADKDTFSSSDRELLMRWAEQISRTAERLVRMRNDTAMTAAELKLIAARLADTVARYMPDDEDRQRAFLAELLSSMGMQ